MNDEPYISLDDMTEDKRDKFQCRNWHLVINNPIKYGFTHANINKALSKKSTEYYCMVDEIGHETGTPHTHIYIRFNSPVRFRTVKKLFPQAHIDKALGTAVQNIQYLNKMGKWKSTDKADTTVPGTFEQHGDLPSDKAENKSKKEQVIDLFLQGYSVYEVIEIFPELAFKVRALNELRAELKKTIERPNRDVQLFYYYGDLRSEAVRSLYAKYSSRDIFRLTDYNNKNALFDQYHGQRVLVLDNFLGQITLQDMLIFTDILPLDLPARYQTKEAEFDEIYIVSPTSIGKQYISSQKTTPGDWNEFVCRIHSITEFCSDGLIQDIDPTSFLITGGYVNEI